MKTITLWQPWGTLVMIGAKPNEFRTRSFLEYRGCPAVGDRIVIHAGARPVRMKEIKHLIGELANIRNHTGLIIEKAMPLLRRLEAAPKCVGVVALGCGLGTAVLGEPRRADAIYGGLLPQDSDRGEFNFAWPMRDIVVWDEPRPMRGMQGFWDWPGAV